MSFFSRLVAIVATTFLAFTTYAQPRYEWRGAMLDLSRHYFPIEHIHRQIDALSRCGINVLHLHLTDAAGWRMEIKRYPQLTDIAAWRTAKSWKEWWNGDRGYVKKIDNIENDDNLDQQAHPAFGGYYTQEQLREVVRHAASLGITVVPEIEMPGHSEEIFAAFPELLCEGGRVSGADVPHGQAQADFCAGNDKSFEVIFNILDEVMDVFPSPYIHIGGDEAGRQLWKTCGRCQARMREHGFETTAQMQAWFMRRVADYLSEHGRRAVCWDEVLEGWETESPHPTSPRGGEGKGLPIIMCWRGQAKGAEAVSKGFDVVMCPGEFCYFDNAQDAPCTQPEANGGYLPFDKVYSYDPSLLTGDGAAGDGLLNGDGNAGNGGKSTGRLIGLQGNLWAEYIPTPQHAEYMLYPRILALAMVGMGYDYTPEVAHNIGCRFVADMKKLGYHPFDLNNEVGQRPEMADTAQHLARGCKVSYRHRYSDNYAAAGDASLTDGIRGGWANNDGRWQGFIGAEGMDVVIDLGEKRQVSEVSADFQQICQPDIFAPARFIVSTSNDGRHFKQVASTTHDIQFTTIPSVEHRSVSIKARTRYLRIQALPRPEGGWVFCDEIVVK